MPNDAIKSAYRYHRQTRPTLSARRALEYAHDDARNNVKRYTSSTHYASVVNPPFRSGSTTLRWIERPESIGLRLVGFADEISRNIDHKGWYTNEFCDSSETLRGIVFQWPSRHGVERYVYGYADPDNEGAAALCFDVTDDKNDAARWADSIAEYAAGEEREYQAASSARFQFDELGEDISDTRKSALRLIAELKAKRRALCDAPAIIAALRSDIEQMLDSIREARERRVTLENEFSCHAGWTES
jgi:hypothetical protein